MGLVRQPSDAELALRAASGDRRAFEVLVRRHSAGLYALCRRILGDPGEAEDRVQEAFLRAYEHLPRYRPAYRFSSWLYKIAQNLCIDSLRARRAWAPLVEEPPAEQPTPIAPDQREALAGAVEALAARDRTILHMKYTLGLNATEIARELDMTPGSVRVCLHRAIHSLRARLKP